MKNVLLLPYEPKLTEQPTEKRPAMFASFIRASSNPGELGLDPFAGSGSTAAVARRSSGLPRRHARSAPTVTDVGSRSRVAQHLQLRIDTGLRVYFCDPHSPWQRGTNENTNRLLRQYSLIDRLARTA